MRFQVGKTRPYPVLRPKEIGDDYPEGKFWVSSINKDEEELNFVIPINYVLKVNDKDLLELVRDKKAQYALLIKSTRSQYRQLHWSDNNGLINVNIPMEALAGRVNCMPLLITKKALKNFKATGWHKDYTKKFDIDKGQILAEDWPFEFNVGSITSLRISSIMKQRVVRGAKVGFWKCDIGEDFIWISMSEKDSEKFELARMNPKNSSELFYLVNGIYFPALVWALNTVDRNVTIYEKYKWFDFLNDRLNNVGCDRLGTLDSDRLKDAQKIFECPYLRMPIIHNHDT